MYMSSSAYFIHFYLLPELGIVLNKEKNLFTKREPRFYILTFRQIFMISNV